MTAINSPTFYKEGMWTPAEVVWRPGVEFSMLADWPSQKYRTQTAKLRCNTRRRLVTHLFCSWMGKRTQYFLTPTSFRDDEKIIKCYKSEGFSRSDYHVNEMSNSECSVPLLANYPVEEPWLIESSACIESSAVEMVSDSFEVVTESTSNKSEHPDPLLTNYPVEEPWLFESSTCTESSSVKVVSDSSEQVSESTSNEQHQFVTEMPLLEEEGNIMTMGDSVSTVILINSSICTVQRIAVLENDKLVELLLEPVKTNVQCDSVYLGVVSKLVPHMGGAFVNIGSPRPSFMDIRPNREPFILHSFHGPMKEREVNGSTSTKPRDGIDFPKIGALLGGAEEPDEIEDDQSEDEFDNDEFESHENRFHLDFLEVIKEKVNGTVVRHEREDELDQLNEDVDQQQSDSVDQDIGTEDSKWAQVKKGSKIIVQVVKEGLGTKGPTLTAYPKLRSRFWVLSTRCNTIGISKKISGLEKTRLRAIARSLQPQGFGLTVRTVASGHSVEELQKDLEGLLSTWKSIVDHAKSAALAADEGVEGSVPVLLHRAMGKTLSVVQDYFNEKVKCMVVDSPRTYHEVTNYLQDIAPNLCDRVQLYSKRTPLFDEYGIEEEINNVLSKRVPLTNGGYLVIEQTEALVSIDVNGGQCMLGQGTSQEKAILEVNLAAAKQIARELRLRDIGGIIVVDFIDMMDDSNNRLVYEEVKKAVERDRSTVRVSELSTNALMEITRKRVRPSVTFMISEPCTCCHATGRVEALETVFSKIEREICRFLSKMEQKADPENPKSWPRFILRVDQHMCNYLTTGKRTKLAVLSSSLKVWILLKVARGLTRGKFELKCLTDENIDDNVHHLSLLLPKKNFRQESNPLSLQKAKQLGI